MKRIVVVCAACDGSGFETGGFVCHFCGGNGGHAVPANQIDFDLVDETIINVAGEVVSVKLKEE